MPCHAEPCRLLILGGSGFLSGTLARTAAALGHAVTVVTRGRRPTPDGVVAVTVDRNDRAVFADRIASLGSNWDLVVDAIPYTPEDAEQDVTLFTGRTRRLVFVSSDFVYDPLRKKLPQAERDAAYATHGYGMLKRQAELVVERAKTTMLPWTILRPSHIYGPGSLPGCLPLHGRDPALIERILQRQPLRLVNGGRFLQQPVFAQDVVHVILSAVQHTAAVGKVLNVAGPDILTSEAYFHLLGSLLDREVTIEAVSTAEVLSKQPDKAMFCCDRVYDLASLRDAGFDLPQTSLKDGLRLHVEALGR
jgi:nucleoside-diphosphate-sugar epimerase